MLRVLTTLMFCLLHPVKTMQGAVERWVAYRQWMPKMITALENGENVRHRGAWWVDPAVRLGLALGSPTIRADVCTVTQRAFDVGQPELAKRLYEHIALTDQGRFLGRFLHYLDVDDPCLVRQLDRLTWRVGHVDMWMLANATEHHPHPEQLWTRWQERLFEPDGTPRQAPCPEHAMGPITRVTSRFDIPIFRGHFEHHLPFFLKTLRLGMMNASRVRQVIGLAFVGGGEAWRHVFEAIPSAIVDVMMVDHTMYHTEAVVREMIQHHTEPGHPWGRQMVMVAQSFRWMDVTQDETLQADMDRMRQAVANLESMPKAWAPGAWADPAPLVLAILDDCMPSGNGCVLALAFVKSLLDPKTTIQAVLRLAPHHEALGWLVGKLYDQDTILQAIADAPPPSTCSSYWSLMRDKLGLLQACEHIEPRRRAGRRL